MAEKFNEFSKHLARKQTRRGALKFMGAGLVSAFVATVFTRGADADRNGRDFFKYINFNKTNPNFNGTFVFNATKPFFNATKPVFNETIAPIFNQILSNPKLDDALSPRSRSILSKVLSFLTGGN
jgi:hypothetical protein